MYKHNCEFELESSRATTKVRLAVSFSFDSMHSKSITAYSNSYILVKCLVNIFKNDSFGQTNADSFFVIAATGIFENGEDVHPVSSIYIYGDTSTSITVGIGLPSTFNDGYKAITLTDENKEKTDGYKITGYVEDSVSEIV